MNGVCFVVERTALGLWAGTGPAPPRGLAPLNTNAVEIGPRLHNQLGGLGQVPGALAGLAGQQCRAGDNDAKKRSHRRSAGTKRTLVQSLDFLIGCQHIVSLVRPSLFTAYMPAASF